MAAFIKGETGDWEMVIGLEVHAQIIAKSKLFSGASCEFGGAPNSHVSLVDAAMPGMLPVLNQYCVEQAVRTGLGLKSQINMKSIFERKNYFYPDLPQGYQISQFLHPIVGKGMIEIDLADGTTKQIGVTRLHLEQDAGKSIHDQHPTKSYVDLNRAGCALMEIVSEPDLRGPGRGLRLYLETTHDPAVSRDLRRQHGRRIDARRRQPIATPPRRAARHTLRDQERQLDQGHPDGN